MSAYIVDREHIQFLVEAALHYGIVRDTDATLLGLSLWRENVKSVENRYPNRMLDELPGPGMKDYEYEYDYCHERVMGYEPRPLDVIKAVHCYEYQSCEHEGWAGSKAAYFCAELVGAACRALPGYDEAKWGAPSSFDRRRARHRLPREKRPAERRDGSAVHGGARIVHERGKTQSGKLRSAVPERRRRNPQ